jgi:hypothetical protein
VTSLLILPSVLAKVLVTSHLAVLVLIVRCNIIIIMKDIPVYRTAHYNYPGMKYLSRHKDYPKDLLAKVQPCK